MVEKLGAVNSLQKVSFGNTEAAVLNQPLSDLRQEPDIVELSTKQAPEIPKIGFFRLAFNRLTQEQIDTINTGGKLPENAKFYTKPAEQGGYGERYRLGNNILNIQPGTTTLPAGYELKKDWLGFTKVVPKDTTSIFIRENK